MRNISSILLAGGKSRRFGSDKKNAVFDKDTLLNSSVKKLESISDELIIVFSPASRALNRRRNVVYDLIPDKGPLIGIYTGLKNIRHEKALIVPIDTPFLTTGFLNYLIDRSKNYDAVIPIRNKGLEPLIGVYDKSLIKDIDEWLKSGRKMVTHLFLGSLNKNRINFIEEDDVKKFGDPEKLFLNINRMEDMNKARMYNERNDK